MSTPSIVPNDRLDKDFYLVLEDFRAGPSFRETDEGITYIKLIDDLLTGQYAEGREVSEAMRDFIEGQTGKIGQQLVLFR